MSVRFAPSPTGNFHVGNFRTAWISHRIARLWGVPWVVRFEDIDRPRVVASARARQLSEMKALGMVPDETHLQSEQHERHWELFSEALADGQIYPCFCSRKEIRENVDGVASAPHGDPLEPVRLVYSGRCRSLERTPSHSLPSLAWRFRSEDASGAADFIVARTSPDLDGERRPEKTHFTPAYHWACAIDDYFGEYELLVRAADLAGAIEQQRRIQSWIAHHLGETEVHNPVFHTALVVQDSGQRLEKRTKGVTFEELLAKGWTAKRLRELFERSFEMKFLPRPPPDSVMGERARVLRLSEIGLSLSENP